MTMFLDAMSWVCLVGGAAFCIIGAIGLIRLTNFYDRTHAAGITDTMGAGLILVGLILQAGPTLVGVKLVMILIFIYLTSPAVGYGVAKAAFSHGVEMPGDQSEIVAEEDGNVISH